MSNPLPPKRHCSEDGSKGEELRHKLRHTEMFAAAKGSLLVEQSQLREKPQHLLRLFLVTESPLGRRDAFSKQLRISEDWAYSGQKRRNCELIFLSSSWKCRKKKWNQKVTPWYGWGSAGFALTKPFYTSDSGGEVPCYLLFQSCQVYQERKGPEFSPSK